MGKTVTNRGRDTVNKKKSEGEKRIGGKALERRSQKAPRCP